MFNKFKNQFLNNVRKLPQIFLNRLPQFWIIRPSRFYFIIGLGLRHDIVKRIFKYKSVQGSSQHECKRTKKDIVITFTGGLGAQIFSCAIYNYLKSKNNNVYADLTYFDAPPKIAREGSKGEVSIWAWALGEYNISKEDFALPHRTFYSKYISRPYVLSDEMIEKARLGIEALSSGLIKQLFPISQHVNNKCREIEIDLDYLCVHLRRGDYLNVAGHVVKDEEFLKIINKFKSITHTIVIVSDSEISDDFKAVVQGLSKRQFYFVKSDTHLTHALMRNARHLICSNSQFSLTAAFLNSSEGFIMVPCNWFGGSFTINQEPINILCNFQLISRVP